MKRPDSSGGSGMQLREKKKGEWICKHSPLGMGDVSLLTSKSAETRARGAAQLLPHGLAASLHLSPSPTGCGTKPRHRAWYIVKKPAGFVPFC